MNTVLDVILYAVPLAVALFAACDFLERLVHHQPTLPEAQNSELKTQNSEQPWLDELLAHTPVPQPVATQLPDPWEQPTPPAINPVATPSLFTLSPSPLTLCLPPAAATTNDQGQMTDDLAGLTITQLRALAKGQIKGFMKMSKAQLIQHLSQLPTTKPTANRQKPTANRQPPKANRHPQAA